DEIEQDFIDVGFDGRLLLRLCGQRGHRDERGRQNECGRWNERGWNRKFHGTYLPPRCSSRLNSACSRAASSFLPRRLYAVERLKCASGKPGARFTAFSSSTAARAGSSVASSARPRTTCVEKSLGLAFT